MADVSVEFGAKDTGLEQTLKTVQDELTKLESEVKSGELSFDALQQAMRKLAQTEKLEAQLQAMATGVDAAGNAAAAADPKVDAIGKEMKETGNQAKDVGDKSQGGFLKMSAAVAAGQSAVNVATAAMKAAFNVVKGAVDDFGAALDLGGRLSDLSERTGEAAGNVLLLERAFQNSGAGAEKVGPAINKLQKFIEDAGTGAKEQVDAMDRLGISLDDLAGKTPTEQMQVLADRITAIEDPGKRAALAMEVFGRAGGELLPLLTNFSGELGTAQDQLGGMVDIMNRQNAIFDAVSDKIAIIRGKFMEFAAGVLDKVAPALDAVTEALSRIDAAAIGQKIADAFTGGVAAMNGFQAAVDAFKTGNIEGALSLLWESIKLQAMQTADAIYKNLSAAFSTAADIIREIFRADGPAMSLIKSSFSMVGDFITEKLYSALSGFMESIGRLKMAEVFQYKAETAARAVGQALDAIPVLAEVVAIDAGDKLATMPEKFKENLSAAGSLFPGLEAQAAALAAKQEEVAAAAEKYAPAIESATNSTQDLTESIVESKDATTEVVEEVKKVEKNIDDAVEEADQFKSFVEYMKAQDLGEPVKPLSEKTREAREEIEAFGDYIGQDLDRMSFPDIAKKLGIDTMGMTGSEQIDAIVSHIKSQLPDAKINPVDEGESKKSVDNVAGYLKDEFKSNADLGFATGEGQKILSGISTLVSDLKTIVQSLSDKLPMQALAY